VLSLLLAKPLVAGYRTYRHVRENVSAPPHRPIVRPPELASRLEDVVLASPSGPVAAWYLPARNGVVIVHVHGSSGDRLDAVPDLLGLEPAGYGAVAPDIPGHGESGGSTRWGRDAQRVVGAAIDFASQRAERVAVLGFSMGSSVAAHVAASDPRVAAVILTGAFDDLRSQLRHEFRRWGPFTQWPASWAAEQGLDLDDLDTTQVVGSIAPRPVLVVGGAEDALVPPDMVQRVYAAAHEPKAIEIVPGATHGAYGRAGGPAYYERMRRFLDDALGRSSPSPRTR
jgi:alpha-beta hydrolase superfamily lysophospholipase